MSGLSMPRPEHAHFPLTTPANLSELQIDPLQLVRFLRHGPVKGSSLYPELQNLFAIDAPLVVQGSNIEIANFASQVLPWLYTGQDPEVHIVHYSEKLPPESVSPESWVVLQEADALSRNQQQYWFRKLTKIDPSLSNRMIVTSQFNFTHLSRKGEFHSGLARAFSSAVLKLNAITPNNGSRSERLRRVRRIRSREDKDLLFAAIEKSGGNLSKAARLLGKSRGSIRYQIQKYQSIDC